MKKIIYNGDKFLKDIAMEVEALPSMQAVKDFKKQLFIYGLNGDRGIDVAIPNKFPKQRELLREFQKRGMIVRSGCFYKKPEELKHLVLGLGYNMRLHNNNTVKRVIVCTFMALNDIIKLDSPKEREKRAEEAENKARDLFGTKYVEIKFDPTLYSKIKNNKLTKKEYI